MRITRSGLTIPERRSTAHERRSFATHLELRGEGEEARLVGHAAVFESLSLPLGIWKPFREKIAKGAFAETISKDDIRALWSHDTSKVLGRNKSGTLKLTEDDRGLHVEITPGDTSWGRDAMIAVKRGDVSQMSFGFMVPKKGDRWDVQDGEDIRTLLRVQLLEVSPVAFPAYQETDISSRAIGGIPADELLEVYGRLQCGTATNDDLLLIRRASAALAEEAGPTAEQRMDLMKRRLQIAALEI